MRQKKNHRWQRALKTALSLGVLALAGCLQDPSSTLTKAGAKPLETLDFDEKVQSVLDEQIQLLEHLAAAREIRDGVIQSNRATVDWNASDIAAVERRWAAADVQTEPVRGLLASPLSRVLAEFQSQHRQFAEILVTDVRGFLVAATNRTSDYFQADEDWWVTAYAAGEGRARCGQIEYDPSAQDEGVSLLLPIHDPDSGRLIGVLKAVYRLTSLKKRL